MNFNSFIFASHCHVTLEDAPFYNLHGAACISVLNLCLYKVIVFIDRDV